MTEIWPTGPISETAWCQRCDNPSPMTLEGTNTWILGRADSDVPADFLVIDPGPEDPDHLSAVHHWVSRAGGRVAQILLTHHHLDHTGGVQRFVDLTGAPVRGAGYGAGFSDGEVISGSGVDLEVVLTPGHTADSVCFLDRAGGVLYSGDTILGRGTTVVAHPDGTLAPYLDSLARLQELASSGAIGRIAPGHGPVLDHPDAVLAFYLEHRRERLEQVREVVQAAGGVPPAGSDERAAERLTRRIVEEVYAEVPRAVWPAAQRSVRAQLDYLSAEQG